MVITIVFLVSGQMRVNICIEHKKVLWNCTEHYAINCISCTVEYRDKYQLIRYIVQLLVLSVETFYTSKYFE